MLDEPITIEAHVARNSDNTLQRKCVPLIFVPGIMGTRLDFVNGGSWDPGFNSSTLGLFFKSMEREANELDYRNGATLKVDAPHLSKIEIERGWASVVWNYYGKFLNYINDPKNTVYGHLCPVYALGYDWRQSNYDSALVDSNILSAEKRVMKIMKDNKAEQCVLITHSMGGLVVRSLLKNSKSLKDKIAAVVHVAQPVNGAVVFYRRFFSGAEWDGTIPGFIISRIQGSTPEKFAHLLSIIASGVELAPNNQYLDRDKTHWLWRQEGQYRTAYEGDVYSLYGASTSPPALVDPLKYTSGKKKRVSDELAKRIADAKAFHENLGDCKIDATWAIYGVGHETDVAVTHYFKHNRTNTSVSYDKTEGVRRDEQDGDGTVPATSASALYPDQHSDIESTSPADTKQYKAEFEHGEAFNSDKVNECVLKIIHYALTGC